MRWIAKALEVHDPESREGYLLVSAHASGDEPRSPVMVNLVLDRSGSMKGAPLSAAVEAAQQLVDLAGPDDFVGLVLFDGVAEQRVPVSAMDVRGKRLMSEALAGIQTGRGTALHGALEMAGRGLQRTLVPGRLQRILLLTDGEPSVGPDTEAAFGELGHQMAAQRISVHALGLAKHYVAEILAALTQPSGNAFEHVDGPEGLSEAMGSVMSHFFGQVASDVMVRVTPRGFSSITCRHAYESRVDDASLVVSLGDVSKGLSRKVLLTGAVTQPDWLATISASWREKGDGRAAAVEFSRVTPDSTDGAQILCVHHELELVAYETAAWLSLARKELDRAESQLERAELHLRKLVSLSGNNNAVAKRHVDRLSDLRLAVERGEGDIPLLIRRAQSARAGTHISQVIPLQAYRNRK